LIAVRFRALALALLLTAPLSARAQDAEIYQVTPQQMQEFRTCRAALFYHLDGALPREARLPRAYAETLLQQMKFIMTETIRTAPHLTVADSQTIMDFTERFFLGFSRTIAERTDLRADVAARERLLIDCNALIWSAMRRRIDALLTRRAQTTNPYAPPGAAQAAPLGP